MRAAMLAAAALTLSGAAFAQAAPDWEVVSGRAQASILQDPFNPFALYGKPNGRLKAFDEHGLNRAPLVLTDQDGKPLSILSRVLNLGADVGCGFGTDGLSFFITGCK